MDFVDLLVRYETALWNHVDRRLRAAGSPPAGTLWALRSVRRHDGACRVHELSHDLQITIGAASKLVDRLERDGLAVRGVNPADARSSLVTLTPDGVTAHDLGVDVVRATMDGHLVDVTGLDALTETLGRLLARVQASPAAVAS